MLSCGNLRFLGSQFGLHPQSFCYSPKLKIPERSPVTYVWYQDFLWSFQPHFIRQFTFVLYSVKFWIAILYNRQHFSSKLTRFQLFFGPGWSLKLSWLKVVALRVFWWTPCLVRVYLLIVCWILSSWACLRKHDALAQLTLQTKNNQKCEARVQYSLRTWIWLAIRVMTCQSWTWRVPDLDLRCSKLESCRTARSIESIVWQYYSWRTQSPVTFIILYSIVKFITK
jgi:hypothetical protein